MPTYDYRCSACGYEVEVVHPIHGGGPEICTVCGGVMRKALSAPAIHFKGSGWAKKDAKTAGKSTTKPKADAAEKKDAAKETVSSGVTKSDESGGASKGQKAD